MYLVEHLETPPAELDVRHSPYSHLHLVTNIGKSEAKLSCDMKLTI
jgi:hypothetical protein